MSPQIRLANNRSVHPALRLRARLSLAAALLSGFAAAVPGVVRAADDEAPPPVVLPMSEAHVLHSEVVGDDFTVQVALPFSYGSGEATYPVVYALDADMGFAGIASTLRMGLISQELPEVILVGQGYANPSVERVMSSRSRDYTPIEAEVPSAAGGGVVDIEAAPTGGAPAFLRFLREELMPFVESRYRTNGERAFIGHSYGGLFGLYTLFHAPDTFDSYLIGSPSIWFGDEVTWKYEEAYAAEHDDLDAKVFFAVGFLEEIPGDESLDGFRMVTNTRKMHHRLTQRAYPSLELDLVLFDEESHMSVVPALISRGVRALLEAPAATP